MNAVRDAAISRDERFFIRSTAPRTRACPGEVTAGNIRACNGPNPPNVVPFSPDTAERVSGRLMPLPPRQPRAGNIVQRVLLSPGGFELDCRFPLAD